MAFSLATKTDSWRSSQSGTRDFQESSVTSGAACSTTGSADRPDARLRAAESASLASGVPRLSISRTH